MTVPRNTCPDCESELQPIKLLDATDPGMGGQGIAHVEIAYAAAHAEASFLTRTVPRLGAVKAKLCPTCGRILLYGEPAR